MTFSVAGKTAIVTGAGSGIGLAIARHLVDKGANVLFADVDEARLDAEVGEEARTDGPLLLVTDRRRCSRSGDPGGRHVGALVAGAGPGFP